MPTYTLGGTGSLVQGTIRVTNAGVVTASLSYLNPLTSTLVPITVTSATLTNGVVNVSGTSLLGNVSVVYTENAGTASVTTILGTMSESVTCYCTGTLIRTTRGEVAVENLAVGDMLVTASGAERAIRWIGRRDYAARFANSNPDLLPVCIKAGAIDEGVPSRDLRVSPRHALFIDGVLIPAAALLNGISVVKTEQVETLTYWHVELESHDVIIAENMPSESFIDDDSRAIFHNAASFGALYPDSADVEAVYCAPRVESGHVLEGVRRRVDARAGLSATKAQFGTLYGRVEVCDEGYVAGWARDALYPDAPVCLDVLVEGELVALVYADQPRTGFEGDHGFALRLPVSPAAAHKVEIRRSADGAPLAGSPLLAPGRMARAA